MQKLILLVAAQFMVILDITVVNIALPSIQGELGIAIDDLQWLITAYTLAFGGLLLVGGRAADLFGRRRMFLTGLGVFTGASLIAGLSDSSTVLIAARVGQGIGAAMLSPAALSLVTTLFPEGPERRRALAAWAAVAAGGGAFGVLAGGFLSETIDWRAIFFINVPVGIAVGIAALRILPATAPAAQVPAAAGAHGHGGHGGHGGGAPAAAPATRIDFAGALLAAGSLGALIYGLVEAPSAGWGSTQTIGLLAAAAIGLIAFVTVEGRVKEPLVSLSVFRRRPTVVALLLMIAGMGTVLSAFFFLTIYLQEVLGHTALETGLMFLPGALLLVATAHAGGQLVSRFGARPVLVAGMSLGAIGALLLSGLPAEGSYLADVFPGLLVLDAGLGFAASGIFITGMAGVEDRDAGMVSGLLTTSHELGIALVLPILSTVAISGLGGPGLGGAAALDPVAVAAGFGDAFTVAAGIATGAALLALVAVRRNDVAPGTAPAFAH